jgi:hypothetical protein
MFWSIGITTALAQANDHKGMNDNSLWIGTPTLERHIAEYQALGVRWFRLELDWAPSSRMGRAHTSSNGMT